MKLLFISQYFHPEIGATSARIGDFAERMLQYGHDVTVIAEFPNFPTGIIPKEYRGKFLQKSREKGINIVRTWVLATGGRRGFLRMMLFYISFMFSSIIGSGAVGECDLVFATSPPLFVGIAGYVISRIKRAIFILDIRDIWPDAVLAVAGINNKTIWNLSGKVETFLYEKADKIVVVTEGYKKDLLRKGVPEDKMELITNGTDTNLFRPIDRNNSYASKLNLNAKFRVLYAGLHGPGQGLDTLIHAAIKLRNVQDILFVFIGEGPEKDNLIRLKEQHNLKNVVFLEPCPRSEIPFIIAAADVGIVHLRRLEAYRSTLPSKIYDYLACGLPIILSVDGDAKDFIAKANAGIWVEPENPDRMAEAILKLYNNPELLKRYRKNGRDFVLANHSRDALAQKLEATFKQVFEGM